MPTTLPTNRAAWFSSHTSKTLEVESAPYTSPGPLEIVIRNGAVAINPIDWMVQDSGLIYGWLKYPFIYGSDVAGEVVEIGREVKRFKVGDRVVSHAVAMSEKENDPAKGAFQLYTVLLDHMTSPIPDSLSYESAAVLPLGVSTAACALFQKDFLALQPPSLSPKPTGKTLLVWGGSTSVGSNAIQLAVAAGYEVITTASPKNFDYVKRLGATEAFDYHSPTVIADIIHAFKDRTTVGAISIGAGKPDAANLCLDVLSKCKGDKFIAMASYPMLLPAPSSLVLPRTIIHFMSWNIAFWLKSKAKGTRSKFIFGDTLVDNGVGKMIYEDFLPQALAQGRYIAAPDPLVVGKGIESIQAGWEVQKKGVSAKKVVISL